MKNPGLRTPRRALRPLAALSALALILGLAVPALAAAPPGAIKVLELTPDGALKNPPAGYKVLEARSIEPFVPDGMALGTEIEPNDTAATANPIAGSEAHIVASITPGADADYFSFSALAGDRVYVAVQTSISNNSTDSQLELFASDGTTQIEFDDDDGSFGSLSSVIAGAVIPTDGTYYIRVDGFSASTLITPYHFHFRLQSGSPTPEVEPNNDPATATPLPAGGWVSGNIDTTTDPDWFSFTLNAGDSVYIALDANPERDANRWDPRIGEGIFNNFILVASDTGAGSATDEAAEAFFMTAKDAGTYYAYVDSTVATGLGPNATYQMVVNIIPKQVQADCTIIPSTDVPVTFTDGGAVTSTIAVPPTVTGSITDVNVLIDLAHANMPDLDVFLASPAATSAQLFTDVGAAASATMNLGLDDNAALPIGPYTVLVGMVNQPEGGSGAGRLSSFNGQSAGGTWTLTLTDDTVNALGGALNNWSLEICGAPPPPYAIAMTKTVSLDPSVCGTSSTLAVPPGTTVYYCYTVTNVGLNDLTTHDLVDDQLGTIFSGLSFTLTPGSSVSTVDLGLTISAPLQTTTTNVATWTGHNGGNSASDDGTATVTVPTHCTPPLQDVTLTFSDFAGTFPPAGWTVANTSSNCVPPGLPDWTNTNPGNRANLTGSVGPFAIADSDRCGSGSVLDTTLDTPALDLTTLTDPVVHFRTDYDDIGTGDNATAVLEVSTDGGATFAPVFTWDEDHRGPLAIDQPIPGAGSAGVIVRWHYVNGTWDWWWEVDEPWVTACAEPSATISLVKTVGTVPAVCAATDSVTVNTGTDVYYCYTVTNTGSTTFEFHDLVDDQLGTLLDDAPYTLVPGDSAQLIAHDVATATVTNTGTWTAATNLPGYTVDDTIPFDFTDISGTGTGVTLGDDEMSAAIPMGFSFDYFGTTFTDAYICSNGFVTFLPGQSCPFTPDTIPTPGDPDGIVAGYWTDLFPPAGGTIQYETQGSAPNRVFIVQFTNIGHCCGGANPSTFEWKLFEGSNVIETHYLSPDSDGSHNHVVGIENLDGTAGNLYYEGIAALPASLAVQYSVAAPPITASASDTATVVIEDPDIQVSPTDISSFQPVDTQTTHDLDITNLGPADLNWTITEDAGLVGHGAVAKMAGNAQPLLPNVRRQRPAEPAKVGSAVSSDTRFSRAAGTATGKVAKPERGEAPDATVTITHSSSQSIVTGNSVSCNAGGLHTDNSYIRRFTLTDFGIGGNFAVTQVEVGIEQAIGAGGTQPVTVNLYTWDPNTSFTFGNFSLIGTANASVPDQSLTIVTVPVTGVAPAGSTLVVEFFTPNGQAAGNGLFVGSNADPQTDATFLAAADCGVPEPLDTAAIGFPDMHLVMNVTGTTGCDADLPWLSASPTAGTTTTGNTDTVTVTLDSTGLTPGGTYTGSVCVNSNDPDTPEILVPVILEVDGMPFIDGFETGNTSRWSVVQP